MAETPRDPLSNIAKSIWDLLPKTDQQKFMEAHPDLFGKEGTAITLEQMIDFIPQAIVAKGILLGAGVVIKGKKALKVKDVAKIGDNLAEFFKKTPGFKNIKSIKEKVIKQVDKIDPEVAFKLKRAETKAAEDIAREATKVPKPIPPTPVPKPKELPPKVLPPKPGILERLKFKPKILTETDIERMAWREVELRNVDFDKTKKLLMKKYEGQRITQVMKEASKITKRKISIGTKLVLGVGAFGTIQWQVSSAAWYAADNLQFLNGRFIDSLVDQMEKGADPIELKKELEKGRNIMAIQKTALTVAKWFPITHYTAKVFLEGYELDKGEFEKKATLIDAAAKVTEGGFDIKELTRKELLIKSLETQTDPYWRAKTMEDIAELEKLEEDRRTFRGVERTEEETLVQEKSFMRAEEKQERLKRQKELDAKFKKNQEEKRQGKGQAGAGIRIPQEQQFRKEREQPSKLRFGL